MNPGLDATEEMTRLTDDEILALVQTRSRRFQRQIRFRDWRELIAGGFAAIMIAPAVMRGPMLARAGALTVLAGVALVAFRLWRARRQGALDASDRAVPVASALRAELEQVDAQITLLRGVAWWYVAPLVGGSVLLVAGTRGQAGLEFTFAYTVGAGLLAWGIIVLNRSAVRRRLEPRRLEILALLEQIES
jgi:cytochrome c biogenesis protein CcdA